ncbi:UNVERIFIED_CONTAM: hypothetical protein FKN15_042163 [Acipenser sinensis]
MEKLCQRVCGEDMAELDRIILPGVPGSNNNVRGPTGERGKRGLQGKKGVEGEKGPVGPPGFKGPQGQQFGVVVRALDSRPGDRGLNPSCEVQAGRAASGRHPYRRGGGGSHWDPGRVQGGRGGSCAAKYKQAVLPVAGTLIGGVGGGPIGILAGFKVAGVAAAVSEGLLSCTGGNLLQKNRKTRIDQDLKELSTSRPDLSDQKQQQI